MGKKSKKAYIYKEGPADADWIKTVRWDLPPDLPRLMPVLTGATDYPTQRKALKHQMKLPSWDAAPPMLKAAAKRFLASDVPIG
jgi:hypothetical protein